MDRHLIALGCALLIAAASSPVLAEEAAIDPVLPVVVAGDLDGDGIANAEDPVDDRFDAAGNRLDFELGERLPPDSYGNATFVNHDLYGLYAPPGPDLRWTRMGDNFYLIAVDKGVIQDAVYHLRVE